MTSKSEILENIPVLILAGGRGTRLQSEVSDRAKPMADINGRPFMDLLLEKYKKHKIYISVGYKKESIINAYKDKYEYIIENEALGTGGAIKKAFTETKVNKMIVLNGDTYTDLNITLRTESVVINTVYQENCHRYGLVTSVNGKIHFKEKGYNGEGCINSGVYIIDKKVLADEPDIFSFEDFLTKYDDIGIIEHKASFIDIGVPEDYRKAVKQFG